MLCIMLQMNPSPKTITLSGFLGLPFSMSTLGLVHLQQLSNGDAQGFPTLHDTDSKMGRFLLFFGGGGGGGTV